MRLVLRFDGQDVQEFVLDKEIINIGRTAKNDIVIDNLAVSSLHACVHNSNDDFILEDMGSTNGTFVNDNKVDRHTLKNSDIITVGKHQLVFFSESSTTSADAEIEPDDSEATVMMSADFQQQLQNELSKSKTVTQTLQKRQEKKSFWGKIKAMLGLG